MCENGLLFDSRTNKCVEPNLSDCGQCKNKEKLPMTDECVLHWHCQNGIFVSLRCPRVPIFHIFDPDSRECMPNKKLPVFNRCSSFRECVKKPSFNHEKWTVSRCSSSLHFDPVRQECVHPSVSTCGSYFNRSGS